MILVHCRRVNKRCAMIAARIRRCICNYISRDIVFRKYFPNFIAFTQVASNSYFPIEKHLNPFLPHEQDFISCYFRALRGPSRRGSFASMLYKYRERRSNFPSPSIIFFVLVGITFICRYIVNYRS